MKPLVIFDAGGVLIRICRTWEEGARRAGIALHESHALFNRELFDVLHPGSDRAAPPDVVAPEARARRRELSHLYQSGRLAEEEYFARMAEAVATATGGDAGACAPDIIARVHDAWLIEEYPGARELVEDLAAAGVATALLSNTNARHWQAMCPVEGEGLCPAIARLDRWFLSHELGACKPDEAIYTAVERAVEAPPDSIIFFDDLEENIAAACGRGWRGVQVDHSGDPPGQMRAHLRELGVL